MLGLFDIPWSQSMQMIFLNAFLFGFNFTKNPNFGKIHTKSRATFVQNAYFFFISHTPKNCQIPNQKEKKHWST